ncbi:MAG TPA: hypothetical protein DCO77_14605 [Nitrospiraceae bacterium]|nr:hypothetical protein [Nitrospiraceae bacterium]
MRESRAKPKKKATKRAKKKSVEESVERSDLKAHLYRKLSETHLFYEVGKIIASALEPSELIEKIADAIMKVMPFDDASVYIVKKDLTGLEPFYLYGPLLQGAVGEQVYFENGAPGMIAATGEPLFVEEAAEFDSFLHHPDEQAKPGSYIGAAMQNDNRVLGVIGFSRKSPGVFQVEEFDLLRTLSHVISAGFEKAELFKKTLELSRVDELTGLYNYRVLKEKLDEEVRRKIRTARDFSFIMIDIDDFKRVNDRYGHLEGSRLLAQMGALLKFLCRTSSTDVCFRYGGEEFSILLAETDVEEAMSVAERVRKAFEEYPFSLKVAHPSERVTISLGVATMTAGSSMTITRLIKEADAALYRSKAIGKNAVTCYGDGCHVPETDLDHEESDIETYHP